jgi:hypothetical protein
LFLLSVFSKQAQKAQAKPQSIVAHIGKQFSLISFPQVKWGGKNIPVEWRN